jgi:hypothetical protein
MPQLSVVRILNARFQMELNSDGRPIFVWVKVLPPRTLPRNRTTELWIVSG